MRKSAIKQRDLKDKIMDMNQFISDEEVASLIARNIKDFPVGTRDTGRAIDDEEDVAEDVRAAIAEWDPTPYMQPYALMGFPDDVEAFIKTNYISAAEYFASAAK